MVNNDGFYFFPAPLFTIPRGQDARAGDKAAKKGLQHERSRAGPRDRDRLRDGPRRGPVVRRTRRGRWAVGGQGDPQHSKK